MKNLIYICVLLLLLSCKNAEQTKEEKVEIETTELTDTANSDLAKLGETAYSNTCLMCHGPKGEGNKLQNELKADKFDLELLKAFVRDQDSLMKSGNQKAQELTASYNSGVMHKFDLTDEEFKALVYYLKN